MSMTPAKPIAVIQGGSTPVIQALLREFANRVAASARVAGVIEDDGGAEGEACGAGQLRSLGDGALFPIFQDLGPEAVACRLDASGVIAACEQVRRDIEAGCDLVVLSKFGKIEVERSGLMDAFAAAIEARVPILTSVSPKFAEAWARFADPLFEVLPPDAARIEAWWRVVRSPAEGEPLGTTGVP
jgi:hypothetical protein